MCNGEGVGVEVPRNMKMRFFLVYRRSLSAAMSRYLQYWE